MCGLVLANVYQHIYCTTIELFDVENIGTWHHLIDCIRVTIGVP